MYIRDYNKATTLYDTDAFIVDGSQETMYILVSDLYNALIGSKGFVTEEKLNAKNYQTKQQVDNNIEARGYVTALQADKLITDKGYQTESQVETIVESYGYQNSSDVNRIIEAKGYQTKDQVDSNIDGRGYLTGAALEPYITETELDAKDFQNETEVVELIKNNATKVDVDSEFSTSSENPLQNKVITNGINAFTNRIDKSVAFSFNVTRNRILRFCSLNPIVSGSVLRFAMVIELKPANYYDQISISTILITGIGSSEVLQSVTSDGLAYKKTIQVFKDDNNRLYFYLKVPDYNDKNIVNVLYTFQIGDPIFEEIDVTDTWETEISGKTLLIDSETNQVSDGGMYLNKSRVLTEATSKMRMRSLIGITPFAASGATSNYTSPEGLSHFSALMVIGYNGTYNASSSSTVQTNGSSIVPLLSIDNWNVKAVLVPGGIGNINIIKDENRFSCNGSSGKSFAIFGIY